MDALDGDDIARLVYFSALAIMIGAGVFASRRTLSRDLKAFAFWMAALAGLVAVYGFRDEAKIVWSRFTGTLVPGLAVEAGGEVTIARSARGMFVAAGEANGVALRFLFDTGASSVVLTHEDAVRAGVKPGESDYSITVQTANGAAQAAPVTLAAVRIGPIRREKVRALVARPGALTQSLLGHTFLNLLASYEVRGDRLILRDK